MRRFFWVGRLTANNQYFNLGLMDAEVSTHTFLTMIIEESVCFMSCEPIFLCNYSYVVHTVYIYLFFSSTEHCAWAIISPKELKSWITHISFALLYRKTEIVCALLLKSAFEWIFNDMQLILVKIKWHIKWKYLIKKFHDICLSYYFNEQCFIYCCSHSHSEIFNNKHNSYLK